jgi:DNA-binding winged helix-turn-helix (wHTH) protein/TolB-like protein/Tfp pilus assembly protein PilF
MDRQGYAFGPFRIDARSRILLKDGERVPIPPKSADLLLVLLERGGDLVSRDELLKLVWPDTFVEDNNLAKHIFLLRKTLGNDEQGAAYIETVPKRGYRFIGQVEPKTPGAAMVLEYEDDVREHVVIEETDDGVRPRSGRGRLLAAAALVLVVCVCAGLFVRNRTVSAQRWRSVLILPFTTTAAPNALLGSAFTQEVAARLRTIRSLRVVSPLSQVDAADTSKRLGVETILSGRVEFTEGRVRVAAQLVNAEDASVLWAEEATALETADLHRAQAALASAIAARLCGRLLPGERTRLERRGSTNSDAYQAFLRGRAELMRIDVETAPVAAARHFETAIRLDGGFADAWAGLASAQQAQFGRGSADRSVLAAAIDNARRALSIDPDNVPARHALIRIYHSTGQGEAMLGEAKRVLESNPADPESQTAAALAYFRTGMLDRAIDLYEKYLAAYPDDEDASYQLVHACLFARQYDRGIRHAQPLLAVQRLLFPTFLLYANSGDSAHAVALARQSILSRRVVNAPAYFAPQVLDRAGLHKEAREAWLSAAEQLEASLRSADNERARMFLAMIYARLGKPDAARDQVRRAAALNPGDPWIAFFSSETYALLEDRAAALASLRRGIAGGFLSVHYLDYYEQAPNGWHRYRQDPEFVAIRGGLARKVAELRTRY